jgi:hypothetical protein
MRKMVIIGLIVLVWLTTSSTQIQAKDAIMFYEQWFTTQTSNQKMNNQQSTLIGPSSGYLSNDVDVIKKHAELLKNTGIDAIMIDWAFFAYNYDRWNRREIQSGDSGNQIFGITVRKNADLLFNTYANLNNPPKITLLLGVFDGRNMEVKVPGDNSKDAYLNSNQLKDIFNYIYENYITVYPNLFYKYQGKPLVTIYTETPSPWYPQPPTLPWNETRFTVRWMTGYAAQQAGGLHLSGWWSFVNRSPVVASVSNGKTEHVSVTPAYPGQGNNPPQYVDPREDSWNSPGAVLRQQGQTFRSQLTEALALNPDILEIAQWNGFTPPDSLNPERSGDIEPTSVYGTVYIDILKKALTSYKGPLSKTPVQILLLPNNRGRLLRTDVGIGISKVKLKIGDTEVTTDIQGFFPTTTCYVNSKIRYEDTEQFGYMSLETNCTVLLGDLNTNGSVDIFDYNILVSKFGNPHTIFDYNQLVANFGKSI